MTKKQDFTKFKLGTVFNQLKQEIPQNISLIKDVQTILFPSRLNAMAIDPSKIATNDNLIYTPGEVVFSINLCKKIHIKVLDSDEIIIHPDTKRPSLVRHATILMQKALNLKHGFEIKVENSNEIKHAGLGSSSGLISGVMACINEMYGKPISSNNLVKYSAQNHGEEIDGDENNLIPVQCIGGSCASGLFEGSVLILAGESEVVATSQLNDKLKVIIGVPEGYNPKDSQELMRLEELNFDKFIKTGEVYGKEIAYRMFHKVLPELKNHQVNNLGDLVFNYRFNMGSIDNCSFVYDAMVEIANKVKVIKEKDLAQVLSLSSVGPSFFVITENVNECRKIFEKAGLYCIETELFNSSYITL